MGKKPIIGIVGRSFKEEEQSIIELNEDYRLAIVQSGGIPLIIIPPNNLQYDETLPDDAGKLNESEKNDLYRILKLCDGILMPGGSRWYEFDEVICQYALDQDVPILGICLGMQILGNVDNFCGTIYSDGTQKNETDVNHCQERAPYVHTCQIEKGMLHDILKTDQIKVNSRHHYHVVEKDYFHIDAYSEDGLIEAIDVPNHKFALGVQWHPETMIHYDDLMKKIFDTFIKSCKH